MSTAREKVAEALFNDDPSAVSSDLGAPWYFHMADAAIAAHLDALKADGHAVVKLPRGNADWRSVDWQPATGWSLAAYKGQIHIDEASNEPLSPHAARDIAAALLAAATEAQR